MVGWVGWGRVGRVAKGGEGWRWGRWLFIQVVMVPARWDGVHPVVFLWVDLVGEIRRHQWREVEFRRHGCEDSLAVRRSGCDGGHRRHKVRHDNRAGELACRRVHHVLKHGTVAQMHMPVVGSAQDEGVG